MLQAKSDECHTALGFKKSLEIEQSKAELNLPYSLKDVHEPSKDCSIRDGDQRAKVQFRTQDALM